MALNELLCNNYFEKKQIIINKVLLVLISSKNFDQDEKFYYLFIFIADILWNYTKIGEIN